MSGPTDTAPSPPPDEIVIVAPARTDPGTLVDRLTLDDLRRLGTPTVGEALERLPAISSGGDNRGERMLVLRGFTQRQLSVTIDGIPVAVPYDGQLDLSKLPIDLVDHLTVVKGAAPTLYGPGGLGGAINLVTREPGTGPLVRAATESSPWRETRASGAVSVRVGALGALVGGGLENVAYRPMPGSFVPTRTEDGGRRDNTDRRDRNVSAKLTWAPSERHELSLSLAHVGGAYGVPRGVHDFNVRYWRWTDWDATTLGLAHTYQNGRWSIETLLYGSQAANTLDTYDGPAYSRQTLPRTFHSTYDDDMVGARLRTRYRGSLAGHAWSWVTWSGIRHDRHASRGDRDEPLVQVATTTLTASASLEADLLASLHATAALEVDGEVPGGSPSGPPSPRNALALGPMGSVAWTPVPVVAVLASVARRTRFPTLRERFSTAFDSLRPNPSLGAEHATHYALDATVRPTRSLRVAVGVFRAQLTDLIQEVIVAPQTSQQQNLGAGFAQGAEVSFAWTPRRWFSFQGGATLLGTRARTSPTADELPIYYRPSHRLLAVATVRPWDPLAVSFILRQVGPQDFANPDTGLRGHLGTYRLLDARVDYTVMPSLRLWVRSSNLTDALVESRYSFPESGREVFVGVAASVDPAQ